MATLTKFMVIILMPRVLVNLTNNLSNHLLTMYNSIRILNSQVLNGLRLVVIQRVHQCLIRVNQISSLNLLKLNRTKHSNLLGDLIKCNSILSNQLSTSLLTNRSSTLRYLLTKLNIFSQKKNDPLLPLLAKDQPSLKRATKIYKRYI